MKSKIITKILNIIIIAILLANVLPINIIKATTDPNLLISVGTGKYELTVTTSTKINDIINVLGEPKIQTPSAFGGSAYTFYTDNNYSNYLYLETDENGDIASYGSVDSTYKTNKYSYGDLYNYKENGILHGCMYNSDGTIIGGVYYNKEKWSVGANSYNEFVNKYINNYKSDENKYLYTLIKHSVEMFNAIRAKKGITSKAIFNDNYFYINQQLKEYQTNIKDMLNRTGKTSQYRGIRSRDKVDFLYANYYILNPLIFAASATYAEKDLGEQNIAIFDYNSDTKILTMGMVREDVLDINSEIPYTEEEQQKLENGRNLYKSAIEKLYQEEGLFKVEPQTTNAQTLVAGELKDSKKQGIVDYVNMIRAGEGLSPYKLDEKAFTISQYISTLISYRKTQLGLDIQHIPPKPEGVSDEFYQKCLAASEGYAENLGYSQTSNSEEVMMYHINMFVDDSSERPQNFSHRTKVLDTEFTNFGYGISNLTFANEFSGYKASDIVAQTWPANGITFWESIIRSFKWSTQFVKRYKVQENTTVEVKRLNDGKRWTWNEEENTSSRYFTRYTKSIQSLNNKVVFYDSSINPIVGEVYEIVVKNVLDENTNTLVDYKYRTRFEYADTSKIDKRISNLSIEASSDLTKVDNITYKTLVGQSSKLNAKIGTTGTNEYIKMVWRSSDTSKVDVTQNGIIIVKDIITDPITIEVKEEYSGLKQSVKIVTNTEDITMSLDKHQAQINAIGSNIQLNAMLSNGKTSNATWTSEDPNIATVDNNGLVTAKSGGFVHINAKNAFGTDSCWVYVCVLRTLSDGSKVYPGDLSGDGVINSIDAAMLLDWSNEELTPDEIAIADMDGNGIVNAIDAAIIGDIDNGMASFTPGQYNPVTNVTLNKTQITLAKTGNTETLSATYRPQNTTDSPNVKWSTSDSKIATVSNGKVTAVAPGTATITARVGEKTATCMVTIPTSEISGNTGDNTETTKTYFTESKTNISYNNYSNNNYSIHGSIVGSYLNNNSDGTLQKVQLVFDRNDSSKSKVLIEKYDSNFNYISVKEIKYELEICGGYFSGEKYNFLVFGQRNLEDDDNVEVIRVVKYDKNWNKLSQCSINAINTYIPFDAGSCRMVEKNGILYIDTSHKMYKSEDGYHHQSNMLIRIDEETMQKLYTRHGVSNIGTGYVSHSFNQYILADDSYIYTIDHGDAYPRAISICKTQIGKERPTEIAYTYLISGTSGNNNTGVSIGGAELSETSCIIAGNSVKQNENSSSDSNYYEKRNIFITVTNKSKVTEENTSIKWLTNYTADGNIYCNTPQLVKINDNKLVVMWEEVANNSTTIKAVMIDANGNYLSDVITIGGRLSDCKPIIYNNKVVWSVTTGEKAIFFAIDISNESIFNNYNNQGIVDLTKFEHFEYSYDSEKGQYTIGNFDNRVSSITLPKIQYPWMKIELGYQTFYQSEVIKTVIIPEGYTIIPNGCFDEAKNLQSVTLPSTLTEIGANAFYRTKLQSIIVPDSVTKISRAAFASMSELTNVKLPENLTEISELLFSGDTVLEEIIIPSKLEKIGHGAFKSTGLKTITIPNSVKIIEYEAFEYCSKLTGDIVIPESVTTIGRYAFYNNKNVEKLEVKNSNASIKTRVLTNEKMMIVGQKYKATEGIEFSSVKASNENVTVANDGTITAQKEGTATVECCDASGNVIVSTWVRVFKQNTPITKLELAKNSIYLKNGENTTISATYTPSPTTDYTGIIWTSSNENVAKVNSLGKITAIANGSAIITATCEANNSIKATCKVTVADSFTNQYEYKILDDNTIKITKYLGNATNITIPTQIDGYTVTALGNYIFAEYNEHNTTIKKITIPNTVKTIEASFSYCDSIEQLTIPQSVTSLTQNFAGNCNSLKAISVDTNNSNYISIDGVVYQKWNNKPYRLLLYPSGKQDEIFTVPSEVTTIGNWSFVSNSYLKELHYLKNVTGFAVGAIRDMPNLTKVYILNSNASVGTSYYKEEVFVNCPNMTIYGIKDSTAQTHANEYNINFQAIDIKITSLIAEKSSYNLATTNTYQELTVKYEPKLATNTTLSYTSSDTNIATVDSYGRIRAVGNGTAIITVKTTDGSNKSININVNVDIKCTDIRVYNTPTGEITRTIYITAYAFPYNAKNRNLKYSIKDTKIATVNQNGTITPLASGTTELYIETTDGSNIKKVIPITVKKDSTEVKPGVRYTLGDVNNDGKINTLDAVKILQYVAKKTTLTEAQMLAANTNKDNRVNTLDAVRILQYVAKKITKF